jgi:hypothetical protein
VENFLYKIQLPFSSVTLNFKEISTKNQLDIEKLNLFYPQKIDYYLEYHNNFLKIIEKCIENPEDINDINIIDYLLFCLKLRIISIGNTLELQVKSETEENKFVNLKIDLQMLIENLLISGEQSLIEKELILEDKNLKITFGWPNIKSIEKFYNLYFSDISFEEKIIETIPEFIDQVEIKDNIIDFKNLNYDEREKILYLFPASVKNQIQDAILKNIKEFSSFDLFQISYFKDQKFNFFNLIYIEIIKLIFTQNLKRIYEEIFLLSNYNLNSDYVLNMSPSERKIYLSFIEAQRKNQNPQNTPEINMQNTQQSSKSVEDLAVEFGDVPPN